MKILKEADEEKWALAPLNEKNNSVHNIVLFPSSLLELLSFFGIFFIIFVLIVIFFSFYKVFSNRTNTILVINKN